MAQACATWAARVVTHAAASSSAKRGKNGGGGGGKGGDALSLARGGQPRFPVCAWRTPRVTHHDAPSSSSGGGIPVGAYVCAEAATVQRIRAALMDTGRLKAHGVTRFDASTWNALGFGDPNAADENVFPDASSDPWAVHAFAPAQGQAEPAELMALMETGAVQFVPGLRLGNPACYVNLGKGGGMSSEKQSSAFVSPASRTVRAAEWTKRRDTETAARGLGKVTPPAWSPAEPTNTFTPFTYSELFAGIGGFAYALRDIGGVGVFASELCPHARLTYVTNHGCGTGVWLEGGEDTHKTKNNSNHTHENYDGPLVVGDITDVCATIIPKHDLLTGGFPCQSFSKRGDGSGLNDPRGVLYLEICRVLTTCRPSGFLLENVDGLVAMENGTVLESIREALAACGYGVVCKVIDAYENASAVPQRRKRVFLVGFRNDHVENGALDRFKWPDCDQDDDEGQRRTFEKPQIAGILEHEEDALFAPGTAMRASEVSAYQMERAAGFFDRFREGRNADDKHDDMKYLAADVFGAARTLCASYRKSSAYNAELVPPSEKTRLRRPRYYTSRETCRLMGFPETFQPDPDRAWHELGNSVAVPLVRDVAAEIMTALRWEKRD